ncbi:B2 protein [Linum grandiflorum]
MTGNRGPSGRYPGYGAIFMSNRETKEECLRLKLFGLPPSHAKFVSHVKDGMFLFLFEYQSRELHGVFQATSDGAVDIVPHAYSNSGMKYPAQVKFKTILPCTPLPESLFSGAIRDNYFSKYKFHFGLSERQVQNLIELFDRRRLVPNPRIGQVPEGNVTRLTPNLDEPKGAINEVNSNLGMERYGRNAVPGSGSVPSFEHSQNPISSNRRATGVYGSPSIRNDYGLNDDCVPLNSNKYQRDFASNVAVPVSDGWHLARGDLGNGTDGDNNRLGGRSWNCEPNVATDRRPSSTGYNLPILNEQPGASLSNPPVYRNMPNYETNPLDGDAIVQGPSNSTLRYSISDVDTLPRSISHGSYLASYSETVGTITHPYNPDAPSLGINPSYPLPQSSSRPNSAYASHQNQLLPSSREVRQDNSLRYAHSSFSFDVPADNNKDSNRFNMLYQQNTHSEDDVFGDINFPRPALSPPPQYGNQGTHIAENRSMLPVNRPSVLSHGQSRTSLEGIPQYGTYQGIHIAENHSMLPVNTPSVSSHRQSRTSLEGIPQYGTYDISRNNIRNSEGTGTGTGTRTENFVPNSLVDQYGGQGSERTYSNQVNPRRSVFGRLGMPTEVNEHYRTDSEGNDEYTNASVAELMASVRRAGYAWVNNEPVEFQAPKRKDARTSGNKRRVPFVPKPAEVPSEMNTNDATTEEGDDAALLKKEAPFYDFKRRSNKLPTPQTEANSGNQSTETDSPATEQQRKKRKLIRPKFGDGDIVTS